MKWSSLVPTSQLSLASKVYVHTVPRPTTSTTYKGKVSYTILHIPCTKLNVGVPVLFFCSVSLIVKYNNSLVIQLRSEAPRYKSKQLLQPLFICLLTQIATTLLILTSYCSAKLYVIVKVHLHNKYSMFTEALTK